MADQDQLERKFALQRQVLDHWHELHRVKCRHERLLSELRAVRLQLETTQTLPRGRMTIVQELKIYLGHTMFEMQYLKQSGAVSDRLYRHYCFIWLWSADRSDYRHDRFYKRMGSDAYWRRIERVKALCARIQGVELPPADRIPFRVGSLNP